MTSTSKPWVSLGLALNLVLLGWMMGADTEGSKLPASSDGNPAAKKPTTTIEAERLEFDYEKKIGTFVGNVQVFDAQLELHCKQLLIFLHTKSDEVVRVEASGSVHILQQGKEAFSEKAVYTRETGLIVLTEGNPKMKDEKGNWIEGPTIIYNSQTKMLKVQKVKFSYSSSGDNLLGPPTTPPATSTTK